MWYSILLSSRDISVWHLANAANGYLTPVLSWLARSRWSSRPGGLAATGFPIVYVGVAPVGHRLPGGRWGQRQRGVRHRDRTVVADGTGRGRPSTTLSTPVVRQLATVLIVGVSAATKLIPLPLTALRGYKDIRQLPARQLEADADIAAISCVSGPVACETRRFVTGRESRRLISSTRLRSSGPVLSPYRDLASDLVSHRYAMIQAGSTSTPPALLWVPPPINAALTREHYTPGATLGIRHPAAPK